MLKQIAGHSGVDVGRICDFGSGIGNSIPHFRKHFPDAGLTSLDISERSLELSKTRFPEWGEYVLIEKDRIPSVPDAFDVAFSACVFHHIPQDEHVGWLRELHRVTRPGGLIAVFEHNPLNPLTIRAVNTCPFDVNARLIPARDLRSGSAMPAGHRRASGTACFFPHPVAAAAARAKPRLAAAGRAVCCAGAQVLTGAYPRFSAPRRSLCANASRETDRRSRPYLLPTSTPERLRCDDQARRTILRRHSGVPRLRQA